MKCQHRWARKGIEKKNGILWDEEVICLDCFAREKPSGKVKLEYEVVIRGASSRPISQRELDSLLPRKED